MTKPIVFLSLCWTVFMNTAAQDYTAEFGKFNYNEVSLNSYDRDKSAEAVVLFDIGNTFFSSTDEGFKIIFERTTKIKILSKAGLNYAEVEVPFYVENSQMEQVYDLEGYTYNLENGASKRSVLNPENAFQEKVNEHWMVKKFAMPDVKEGSVIEFRYKVMSPYFFNLRDWEFQGRIPVVYSEYTTRMIPFYEYNYILQGAAKFDVYRNTVDNLNRRFGSVEYTDNIYTFGMRNIPAFRDEEYITSINDYIMKMDFQLAVIHYPSGVNVDIVTTWPLLIQSVMKQSEFGIYMKSVTRNSEEIISSLPLGSLSDREKTKIICDYMKANYNWNGTKDKFAGQTVKDFLKNKTGNSADINLFLCSMLNAAGIQCYPVLLSTRDHGKIPVDYPFQQFLNYVVAFVRIDNEDILLDATEPLSPFGMLPARCINEKGLIINKEKVEWIQLTDKINSEITDSVRISFNGALDTAFVDIHSQAQGHKALESRRNYHSDVEGYKKELITGEMESRKSATILNETEVEKPFIVDYGVSAGMEKVGDKLLIVPFPGLVLDENPLKLSYRSYPVDMIYPETNNFIATIDIPNGYTFVDQNMNISIDNLLVKIQYKVEKSNDKIKVVGSYTFRKAVYLRHEYIDLKIYIDKIVETFNNKIVLSKSI